MLGDKTVETTVLHVSTAHSPFDVRIFHKEVLSLAAHGYDVRLATNTDVAQVVNGVQFIPLGKHHNSRWRRFPRNLRALWRMLTGAFDVIHIHDPELLITVIPLLLARRRSRIIYDIHEFYYERIAESDWIWRVARSSVARFYAVLERILLPRFAGIVVVTEEMEADYQKRFSKTAIALVRNFPSITESERLLAHQQGSPLDTSYVVHIGGAK